MADDPTPATGDNPEPNPATTPTREDFWATTKRVVKRVIEGSPTPTADNYVGWSGTIFWAVMIAAVGVALISALVNLWPTVEGPTRGAGAGATNAANAQHTVTFLWGAFDLQLNKSSGLIVLALLAGALGSFVQMTLRFVASVSDRALKVAWTWWYAFRIFSGGVLALIVYLGIRGGLFGGQNASAEVNAYGTAAFAALVGLFSKQALDKLFDVFETVFQTDTEEVPGHSASQLEERRALYLKYLATIDRPRQLMQSPTPVPYDEFIAWWHEFSVIANTVELTTTEAVRKATYPLWNVLNELRRAASAGDATDVREPVEQAVWDDFNSARGDLLTAMRADVTSLS